ncbi:prolipoprotein diacylglyceryl transferase [Alterisphingorhabdus coralli]|uniref:Phosphatidylglycerol--prolipoprotein diacylglyceryl transferase n=1 Tax=Alterisphingorhabdus coralli TaxID=3071408 RepID=A0AA97F8E7_9SPHN|nr:prolipoprotein diacylglyceryl transferase [Parasphingorhabdus sp. SCSIO 66989]WOE75188.1 prolipoprotein diacylglyceryl transferase [Parasphingorhabdus sp. SCSIO 66989]
MILSILASSTDYLRFEELGLSKTLFTIGFFELRWYSLAYLAGILVGYWYLLKLIAQPGAPMARRHADDFILYATLGIILGGRLGYALFYKPELFTTFTEGELISYNLLRIFDGGMSLHGGVLGVLLAIWLMTRKEKLSFLRFCDYIACVVPFGLFFGRLANFVNGELWGRPTDMPWAIIFTNTDPLALPRHPSQLYEAASEGLLMFIILYWLFWHTRSRYKPGLLVGAAAVIYGASRFIVEYFRNPDAHLIEFAERTGLSMGQWLTVPMILIGLALIATAGKRKVSADPVPREA